MLNLMDTANQTYWHDIKRGAKGETALFRAVHRGALDIVSLLIKCGANINDDSNGETALEMAVQTGNKGIQSLLIQSGADTSKISNGARKLACVLKILHLASIAESAVGLNGLLDNGMSVDERDNKGRTALRMVVALCKASSPHGDGKAADPVLLQDSKQSGSPNWRG